MEIDLLRSRCNEYEAGVKRGEQQVQALMEQLEQAESRATAHTRTAERLKGTIGQRDTDLQQRDAQFAELESNYRRVISDLHEAEEKVRELQRELLAESNMRETMVMSQDVLPTVCRSSVTSFCVCAVCLQNRKRHLWQRINPASNASMNSLDSCSPCKRWYTIFIYHHRLLVV